MNESSKLAQAFKALAQGQPQHLAIRFGMPGQTQDIDFAKFWRRVERVTGHLQATLGLQAGQRVAWLGLNHELQCVTLVACARLGLIFMPLNFRLAVAELHMVLQDAQPSVLVYDDMHAVAAKALMQDGHVFVLKACGLDDLISTSSPKTLNLPEVSDDADVLLVYTSGTTGLPKGAVHTQAGLLANAQASQEAHAFKPQDIVLSTLPMFHVGGLCIQTLPALLSGVSVHLHPRFDAAEWLTAVTQGDMSQRPTLSLLVPATLRAVLDHPDWPSADLQSLRGIMAGSSTLPVSYLKMFHARGIPVGQIYGATETGPVSVILKFQDAVARIGFAGWPHANLSLKLVDAQGQDVPQGETGEVCVKAPNVMRGYWNARNPKDLTGLNNGWFHAGDMGYLDAQGCLQIVGRNKDMIISGGENIYPAEIENALASFAGVAECAVVGLPDERWGEVPVLVLVKATGQTLQTQAVMAHLQAQIARFKLPRRVVLLEQLPKSALGKVQKAVLQQQLASMPETSA
jgi:fatty-acyl-CoA synthase